MLSVTLEFKEAAGRLSILSFVIPLVSSVEKTSADISSRLLICVFTLLFVYKIVYGLLTFADACLNFYIRRFQIFRRINSSSSMLWALYNISLHVVSLRRLKVFTRFLSVVLAAIFKFAGSPKEKIVYDRFHGNGRYAKIPTKKEPNRALEFTSRLPCLIIISDQLHSKIPNKIYAFTEYGFCVEFVTCVPCALKSHVSPHETYLWVEVWNSMRHQALRDYMPFHLKPSPLFWLGVSLYKTSSTIFYSFLLLFILEFRRLYTIPPVEDCK